MAKSTYHWILGSILRLGSVTSNFLVVCSYQSVSQSYVVAPIPYEATHFSVYGSHLQTVKSCLFYFYISSSKHNFYTIIDLPLGEHQYKFIVDGHWKLDQNQVGFISKTNQALYLFVIFVSIRNYLIQRNIWKFASKSNMAVLQNNPLYF